MKKESISQETALDMLSEIVSLLNEDQKKLLVDQMQIVRYEKNDDVYSKGELPEYMFAMISGKVKILKEIEGFRPQIMRVMGSGDLFGYRAYFAGENYVTTAAAFETTYICKVPLVLLARLMDDNVALSRYFVSKLASILGDADTITLSLTQKHVRGRLADAIIRLYDTYGTAEDKQTLSCKPSREDLANLSNMITANAIRTLSAFQSEGIIAVDGRTIKLIDEKQLRSIAKLG